MEKRRVVITGVGVVAPNGIGIQNFWGSLVHGQSAVTKISHFDASSYPSQIAAEVHDFDLTDYMPPKIAKKIPRFAQFVLAASRLAIQDAEIDFNSEDPYKVGVFIGTGIGGMDFLETQHIIFIEKGIQRINPFTFDATSMHSAAAIISAEFGFKGSNTTIAAGSNSGIDAIYLAKRAIEHKDADIMLVGAGEAPIDPYIVGTCCAAGFLSRENKNPQSALKPYDIRADGTVLGEGGALIIMEELEHAIRRKAKIYGEILGFSSTIEPSGPAETENCGDTLGRAIETSLMNANLSKKDIDYISAHGSGLLLYDVNETLGIKKGFGELAYQIPVTSIKPVTGDSFSVTGIFQLITCLLVINSSVIPPTINHVSPDPRCDLNYVPNQYVKKVVKNALTHVYGFGGNHSIMIVGTLRSQ